MLQKWKYIYLVHKSWHEKNRFLDHKLQWIHENAWLYKLTVHQQLFKMNFHTFYYTVAKPHCHWFHQKQNCCWAIHKVKESIGMFGFDFKESNIQQPNNLGGWLFFFWKMLQGLYRANSLIQEQDPWKSMSSIAWSLQTKIIHESLISFWCQSQFLLWYPCQRLSSPCQVKVKLCVSVYPLIQYWCTIILVYLSSVYVILFPAI